MYNMLLVDTFFRSRRYRYSFLVSDENVETRFEMNLSLEVTISDSFPTSKAISRHFVCLSIVV